MTRVLMLASFGLEIVECGGALALHKQAGDDVMAALLLSAPESRTQISNAAAVLGIEEVDYLDFPYGGFTLDVQWKERLVSMIRRIKPDIIITQDPQHAQHDLDPDRRIIALLYTEALALAGRNWHVAECGGYAPCKIPTIYYMTPEHPNCIVEISATFELKQQALKELDYQMAFSAESIERQANKTALRAMMPNYDEISQDKVQLGLTLMRQFDMALALVNGLAGHSGAVMGEAYRREGAFVLDRLTV